MFTIVSTSRGVRSGPLNGRLRLWGSCVRRGLRPRAAGDLGKPRATRTWGGGSVWTTAANGGPSNPAIALPLARIFRASGKPIPPGANLNRQLLGQCRLARARWQSSGPLRLGSRPRRRAAGTVTQVWQSHWDASCVKFKLSRQSLRVIEPSIEGRLARLGGCTGIAVPSGASSASTGTATQRP